MCEVALDEGAKDPAGALLSLSGSVAGVSAGDSCRVANFSFASLESANFAARASIFRGCFCVFELDEAMLEPVLTPAPAPDPALGLIPATMVGTG